MKTMTHLSACFLNRVLGIPTLWYERSLPNWSQVLAKAMVLSLGGVPMWVALLRDTFTRDLLKVTRDLLKVMEQLADVGMELFPPN